MGSVSAEVAMTNLYRSYIMSSLNNPKLSGWPYECGIGKIGFQRLPAVPQKQKSQQPKQKTSV
jgi:hypothetical protein